MISIVLANAPAIESRLFMNFILNQSRLFSVILLAFMLLFPVSGNSASKNARPVEKKDAVASPVPPLQQGQAAPETDKPQDAQKSEADPWPTGPAGDAARAYARGDIVTARKIWEEEAKKGDAQAMNNLGTLYDQGKGVEPDAGRAFHWFAESANAGNPSGMNNYGRLLEQGRGVPANPEEAARWFDKAARLGQPEAQFNLGFLYEHGRGVPKDDNAAAAWYSRAASMQQKEALARLGHFYLTGRGVEKNPQRGALLLYAAAMEGSPAAIKELEALAKENPPKASAVLFGQKLDEARRATMRDSLKKTGTPIKREDDQHICDVYDVSRTVPGAGEMAACYGPSGRLAFLKIDYAAPDKNRAQAVLKMVENRFGSPTAGEGEDARIWNLGSAIVATQYAPTHGQISLMYMIPEVYHQTKGKND